MLTWVEHYGSVGGYPVKVSTYWEGLHEGKRMCWITPQSGTEERAWKLSKAGRPSEEGYVIHGDDLEVLKAIPHKK
tara:strand:- start:10180 stop:10407 length:228 start_codon:yes stop_codon:yes gene_type:complete